jgi:periplasmic divalent cation tolerance protein
MIIETACPSADEARHLARELLSKRLIAAGQITAINSLYWWEDQQHEEDEWKLTCLASSDCYQEIKEFIEAEHSYQLPEIIAINIDRLPAKYGQWISTYSQR